MTTLTEALHAQFCELKSRNPAYSLRAYARRLDVNSGVLSAVMNGRRRVSQKWIEKIVPRMGLLPERARAVQKSLQLKDLARTGQAPKDRRVLQLESDQFRLIVEGLHYDLLALFDLNDFEPTVAWMAKRLAVSPRLVTAALERLQRLGLVREERSQWMSTGQILRTTEGIPDSAIRRFHEDRLQEASRALHEVEISERDFLCSTVAIDRQKLPQARRLVREFLERLESVMCEGARNEVYRIGIQIYPVTRPEKEKL